MEMAIIINNTWVELLDPQTERTFYANTKTGECVWDLPKDVDLYPRNPNGEWWEFFDENHQLPYYYHTKTGTTEWLRPEHGIIIPLTTIQTSTLGKRMSVALVPSDEDINIEQIQQENFIRRSHASSTLSHMFNTQNTDITDKTHNTETIQNSHTTNSIGNQSEVDSGGQDIVVSPTTRNRDVNSLGEKSISNPDDAVSIISSDFSGNDAEGRKQYPLLRTKSHTEIDTSPALQRTIRPTSKSAEDLKKLRPSKSQTSMVSSENSYDQSGSDSFLCGSVRKSPKLAEHAKKVGISQPIINNDAMLAMKPKIFPTIDGNEYDKTSSIHITGKVMALPSDLQEEINKFRVEGFAEKYFNEHKRGIFRRRIPFCKLLEFQKESLCLPLMVQSKPVHKIALKCFKAIQRIMGDRSRPRLTHTPSTPLMETQWLLSKGILYGELRDEIYVQICKQLSNNPNKESVTKGWELLCVVSVTFPVSKNFEPFVMRFVTQHFDVKENNIDTISRYVHSRLIKIAKCGPRGKVLTYPEIERAKAAPFYPSVFGEKLDDIMKLQKEKYPDLKIPRILPFLSVAILNLQGKTSEGIFRVPGDVDAVAELRLRIENNQYDIAGITDPNIPSSLFKYWLRELAEPLIPSEFYDECIRSSDDVDAAIEIVKRLPEINRRVVAFTINFLQLFADPMTIKSTKMNTNNLAMVFAPSFLRCPSENLAVVFENTKYEQTFVKTLLVNFKGDCEAEA
ncbi:10612_t:CDS:10 [Paraglomus occultum]|uniref:10612_t:CDS:1 n=1 Tax=Paraglomus occultum TaxID=144539 RepID=A0A9N9G3Q5_9GLOM|nr:10612_t:CDS:10 [Paraglomus occultum]